MHFFLGIVKERIIPCFSWGCKEDEWRIIWSLSQTLKQPSFPRLIIHVWRMSQSSLGRNVSLTTRERKMKKSIRIGLKILLLCGLPTLGARQRRMMTLQRGIERRERERGERERDRCNAIFGFFFTRMLACVLTCWHLLLSLSLSRDAVSCYFGFSFFFSACRK